MTLYRNYHSANPMNACGYAFFTEDWTAIDGAYGEHVFSVDDSCLTLVETLIPEICTALLDSDYADENSVDAIAESFNPYDIVMSAGAYDRAELVTWLCDTLDIAGRGIRGIRTNDGAVVFDPEIITYMGTRDTVDYE